MQQVDEIVYRHNLSRGYVSSFAAGEPGKVAVPWCSHGAMIRMVEAKIRLSALVGWHLKSIIKSSNDSLVS